MLWWVLETKRAGEGNENEAELKLYRGYKATDSVQLLQVSKMPKVFTITETLLIINGKYLQDMASSCTWQTRSKIRDEYSQ